MEKQGHVMGPWRHGVEGFATPWRFVRDADDNVVAWIEGSYEKAMRRGPLVAAAPELLAACKAFVDYYTPDKEHMLGNGQARKSLVAMRAAIAKAEGR